MSETPNFGQAVEGFESQEKPKLHFVYVDNSAEGHPVIFECDADDIAVADAMYEATGHGKPEKQNHVGCSIVKN